MTFGPKINLLLYLIKLQQHFYQSQYPECSMIGWVNGQEYECSTESFGILPLDESAQSRFGMLIYHPTFAIEKKICHLYLAKMQHTCIPIHTFYEQALYQLLVQKPNGLFSDRTQPNWVAVAREWMQHMLMAFKYSTRCVIH
jgi:hypothetical protein